VSDQGVGSGGAATASASQRGADAQRWRLEDQRDFLSRSLADLRAERAAGDIEPADYEALLARDEARLSAVEAELRALEAAETAARAAGPSATAAQESSGAGGKASTDSEVGPQTKAVRRRPLWLGIVAVIALTAGTTLLVVHLAAPSLPGQPVTGSTPQSVAQQLDEAQVLVNEGTKESLGQALSLYREILTEDPNQPQALAETGWLEWEAGFDAKVRALENKGRALVQRSLKVQPDDYGAHLYLGTMELEQDHDAAAAVSQFKIFLAEHPPKTQIDSADAVLTQAFAAAGQPLPPGVPAG
jgi:cytochrome c-type biogenesis protein CcmH/NrfG